eukprot:GHRQ01037799.1.p1 GENE.GHRQ01037799.1~~GHRQ01037799.1.p1  ORF type:complete len:138 (-),score=30.43 GHRQ01037799.1:71-484(-)
MSQRDGLHLQDLLSYQGAWPHRMYIGMGGRELSGTRGSAGSSHDALFRTYLTSVHNRLTASGLGPDRLACAYEPDHAHTESAWAARLPAALQFVAGGWWQRWEQRYCGDLFFTVPRRCGGLVCGLAECTASRAQLAS